MISLNGVTLDNDLQWVNPYASPAAAQSMRKTMTGELVVQHTAGPEHREIQLVATRSGNEVIGVFTGTQIIAFKALEQACTEVVFIYETQTITVIVKLNGVKMVPHIARPNQAVTDEYSGVLTLVEV